METNRSAGWLSTATMWLAVGALTLFAGLPLALGVGGLTVAAATAAVEGAGLAPSSPPYETAVTIGFAAVVLAGLVGFAGGLVRGLRGEPIETGGSLIVRRPFLSLFIGSAVAGGAVAFTGHAGSEETADALAVLGAPALLIAASGATRLAWKAWMAGAAAVARFGRTSTSRALSVAAVGSALTLVLMAPAAPVDAARRLLPTTAVLQAPDAPEREVAEGPFLGGALALPFARGGGDRTSPETLRFEDCVEQLAPEQEGALGGAVLDAQRRGERYFDRPEAEDLAIATLLAVCREYQNHHVDDLKPYYFRSLQNAFRKRWRAPRNESWHADADGFGAGYLEPSALDALIKARDLRCLGEAMRALPEADRAVVYAWIEHESHPRVARQLGISSDAARQRFSRALKQLKDEYRLQCR